MIPLEVASDTIIDLRRYLLQSSQGEWLYVDEHDNFKVTEGFWDKCKVCIEDIRSGFSLVRRTQEAVRRILLDGISQLPETPQANDIHLFNSILVIEGYQLILDRCRLVWGRSIGPLPQLSLSNLPSLTQATKEMEAIQRVLPLSERIELQQYQGDLQKIEVFNDQ